MTTLLLIVYLIIIELEMMEWIYFFTIILGLFVNS